MHHGLNSKKKKYFCPWLTENKQNNRRKYEERNFKTSQLLNNADSSSATWRVAKSFMNWKSGSGPPNQLSIDGKLLTKAYDIANEMNKFFY